MKKMLSLCLVLCMLFCLPLSVSAANAPEAEISVNQKTMVDRFFEKNFTVYGKDGADITDDFYATATDMYQSEDYASILAYLENMVSYAEAREVAVSGARSSRQTIQVTRSFYAMVDDEIHGYQDWNQFYGDAVLKYVEDTNQGTIVSASSPTVQMIDLTHQHGDLEPVITVSSRRAKIASNKLSVDFSFHAKGEEKVYTSLSDEVNALQLAFRYQADFSFTEYAE